MWLRAKFLRWVYWNMSWCSEIRKPQAESNLAQNTPSPKSLETSSVLSLCGLWDKSFMFSGLCFQCFQRLLLAVFFSCYKQNTKTAEVALRATVSPHGRSLPGFCSTKQLGVPYFSPWMGYVCIAGIHYPFHPYIPIYTPGFRETKWSKWNNTMHNADTGNLQSPSHLLEHFAAWKVRETAHTERWSVSTYFDENCSLKTSTLPSPDRNSDALTIGNPSIIFEYY